MYGAKLTPDGQLTATGLDQTHTNRFGAKVNAWLIFPPDQAHPPGAFSKGEAKPRYKTYFADAVNPGRRAVQLQSPTETSTLWPALTTADGTVFNGTVFGNVGGQEKTTGGDFAAAVDGQQVRMQIKNNRGKETASTVDGLMMYG